MSLSLAVSLTAGEGQGSIHLICSLQGLQGRFKCHTLVQFDFKGKQDIVTVNIFAFLGQINVLTKLITILVLYINADSRFGQNLQ